MDGWIDCTGVMRNVKCVDECHWWKGLEENYRSGDAMGDEMIASVVVGGGGVGVIVVDWTGQA